MAQVDYFLKFDGIKGESADAKHKDEIDIESWSWGETNAGAASHGGGGGAGKVSLQDFHFVMRLNRGSVSLMKACATGEHIKEATLSARKSGKGQQEFLVFKFTDLLISSYQVGTAGGDDLPVDQVSFNFARIDYEVRAQNPDGSPAAPVTGGWDVRQDKPV